MPQQIRLWEVTRDQTLASVPSSEINLEERLEDWLESDISILDENLLVIGRQVRTDYGGEIDLFCLDGDGNCVVLELKKGKTPREVTAQALDYASWVKELTDGKISEIADRHFKSSDSLPNAFAERFEDELPDALNQSHRALTVASAMDDSTERIVRYLADLAVPINVATVQHFTTVEDKELLAQVYLVEPRPVPGHNGQPNGGKTRPTLDGLQQSATENGIGHLFSRIRVGLRGTLSAQAYYQTVFYRIRLEGGGKRTVFPVKTTPATSDGGVGFTVHATRLIKYWGVSPEEIETWLPDNVQQISVSHWPGSSSEEKEHATGFEGYFQTEQEIDTFIQGLRNNAP